MDSHAATPREPETPQTALDRFIADWLAPETEYEDAIWRQRLAPLLRQAAAAPGAALDRIRRQIEELRAQIPAHEIDFDAELTAAAETLDQVLALFGATPDPQAEPE